MHCLFLLFALFLLGILCLLRVDSFAFFLCFIGLSTVGQFFSLLHLPSNLNCHTDFLLPQYGDVFSRLYSSVECLLCMLLCFRFTKIKEKHTYSENLFTKLNLVHADLCSAWQRSRAYSRLFLDGRNSYKVDTFAL